MLDPLERPWPEVFSLMWDAYVAGTIPVGAVVADPSGEIVARGRNRIFDDGGDGQFGRSYLAHAEINALLAIPPVQSSTPLTLYSALEPCHLCLSATYSTRMAAVRYAAADPYGGAVGKLLPSRDHEAHPVEVSGPLPGTAGLLPELLHVAHMLWRVPNGNLATFYRGRRPRLVEAARELPLPDSGASLADAVAALESLDLSMD
jgi:tRNA(adenine34) deaminase